MQYQKSNNSMIFAFLNGSHWPHSEAACTNLSTATCSTVTARLLAFDSGERDAL
jgi:hypothetical protein